MRVRIDRDLVERPEPPTPRVLLAQVGKDPASWDLFAACYPGDDRKLTELDEPCEWATVFVTFPKVVNNG